MRALAIAFGLALLLAACGSSPYPPGTSPFVKPPADGPSMPTLKPTPSPVPTPMLLPTPLPVTPDPVSPRPTPRPTLRPTLPPTPSASPIPLLHGPPFTVFVDAGHGGPYYPGATHQFPDGSWMIEKDVNLDVARRLTALLKAAGYNAILDRDGDYTLTNFNPADAYDSARNEIQARVNMANAATADLLVSVHFNSSAAPTDGGSGVYCDPDRTFGADSCHLAAFVQQALVRGIRAQGYEVRDRGVINDSEVGGNPNNPHSWILGTNAGFNPSLMPGIIGEALYLSNNQEAALLQTDAMRQTIAQAYQTGIEAYFHWLTGS